MKSNIEIDGEVIPVRPDDRHVYLVETALVAKGYGVAPNVIRNHKDRNRDELVEGKHWIACATKRDAGGPPIKTIFWTRNGVVRLGFFIKSARAKKFRDLAEDLIIDAGKPRRNLPPNYAQACRALADAVEKGAAIAEAIDLIAPTMEFGAISPRTDKPRTKLIRAHFRTGNIDERTQRFVGLQNQLTLEFFLDGRDTN